MGTGELEASTSKCSGVEAELSQQQQLVARLEEDLLAAEQRHSNPGEARSDAFDGLGSAGPSGLLDNGAICAQKHDIKPYGLNFKTHNQYNLQDRMRLCMRSIASVAV